MKIDLHCHTKKIKDGDPIEREISAEEFNQKIIDNDIKIVAITNHNYFDSNQYDKIVKLAADNYMVWPGIEIDIADNGSKGHAIVIANPEKAEEFKKVINSITQNINPNTFSMNINELYTHFSTLDVLFAFHYNKKPELDIEIIKKFENMIQDKYRVFYEATNYRKMGILTNKGFKSILGSDVRNWNKYNECKLPTLKLEVDSFEQFLLLAKKDYSVVESLLNKKNKIDVDCKYSGKKQQIISIYDDINIVFGAKGSGKSKNLEIINKYFSTLGKNIAYYEADKTKEQFEKKLKVSKEERKLDRYSVEFCEEEISYIRNWDEVMPTPIKNYIEYYETKDASKIRKKIGILEITNSDNRDNELKNISDALTRLTEFRENFAKNISKFLSQKTVEYVNNALTNAEKELYEKRKDIFIEIKANLLLNKSLTTIRNLVDINTETKSKPISCNFKKYAENKLELIKSIVKIDKNLNKEPKKYQEKLGSLDNDKNVYIEITYQILNNSSKTDDFEDGIRKLKNFYKVFYEIKKSVFSKNLIEKLRLINDEEILSIISLKQLVGISKNTVLKHDDKYKKYTPSKGEETMLILQEVLESENEIYILDEPEKSLGNTYINDVIVPIINKLAKLRKTVIIATHNANIAVRTLPYTSIYKEYDGKYHTYVGNPFTNMLTNIDNANDQKDWKETSLKCLEGGSIAFDERGEIYGRK